MTLALGDYDPNRTVRYQGGRQSTIKCYVKTPQIVECMVYENASIPLTFDVEDSKAVGLTAVRSVTVKASALNPDDGTWIPLGSKSETIHLKRCDQAYAAALKAGSTEGLKAVLKNNVQPIAELPGKRLYPGPTEGFNMTEGAVFKFKTVVDIVAKNQLLDNYLTQQQDGKKGDLISYLSEFESVLKTPQCSNRKSHFASFQKMAALSNIFKQRTLERQSMSRRARSQTEFLEARFKTHIKGMSGRLPKPLQILLGVGGTVAPTVEGGLLNVGENILSSGVVSLVTQAVFMGLDGGASAAGISSSLSTRAPNLISVLLIEAQLLVTSADVVHLFVAQSDKENTFSWMEVDAYLEQLASRYENISEPFEAHSSSVFSLENAQCNCM